MGGHNLKRTTVLLLLGPVVAIVFVGYVLPGLALFAISVNVPLKWPVTFAALDFSGYKKLVADAYYARILGYTLLLGLIVSTITAVIAFPVAYYLARSQSKLKSFYAVLTFTPLAVGMNMLTLGWLVILGRNGFVNSVLTGSGIIEHPLQLLYGMGAVVLGLVHVVFTFMVLPVEAVIRQIDPALEKAARILGATPFATFLRVLLPLSMQGIASGFLIVFLQVCGAFVLPLLLGGQGFSLVPISIWEQMTVASDRQFAAVLSIALILVSLVVMILQLRVSRGRAMA